MCFWGGIRGKRGLWKKLRIRQARWDFCLCQDLGLGL